MSATYDASQIGTSLRDYLRFRFRDVGGLSGTTVTKPLLSNEEYDGVFTRFSTNETEAAAVIAEAIGANFAQKVQSFAQSGGIDVVWPRRAEFYAEQARTIRKYGINPSASGGAWAYIPETPNYDDDERLKYA